MTRRAALILLLAPSLAAAWDARGHEQIADLAWTRLTPAARAKIGPILAAGDPEFRPASPAEADVRAAFAKASTWADWIKGKRSPQYDDLVQTLNAESPGVRPTADPFQRGTEENRLKTWHYYDVPLFVPASGPIVRARPSNAVYAMAKTDAGFRAARTPAERCFWLYWAEHVIGDLAQPLHCAESFAPPLETEGDDGGNGILIPDPDRAGREIRLHAFWDDAIERAARGFGGLTETTAGWSSDPVPAKMSLDPKAWVAEGASLALRVVYPGVRSGRPLPEGYVDRAAALSRTRAALAAARLAKWLEARL